MIPVARPARAVPVALPAAPVRRAIGRIGPFKIVSWNLLRRTGAAATTWPR